MSEHGEISPLVVRNRMLSFLTKEKVSYYEANIIIFVQ